MSGYNNGLWYYKVYYEHTAIIWDQISKEDESENRKIFDHMNQQLFASIFPNPIDFQWKYPESLTPICLVTTYPGLLLGTGYKHGSGLMGETKLGFAFDHTTGLPVIPGSSVKGALRSAFPLGFKAAGNTEGYAAAIEAMQVHYLPTHTNRNWTEQEITDLEIDLFGNEQKETAKMGGCIFHDAVPINAFRSKISNVSKQTYLGDDFITPHPNPLKNPNPIAFVKVLPGVEFRFQFDFSKMNTELITIDQLTKLFTNLLIDYGTGAKTNVDYGLWTKEGTANPPSKYPTEQARNMQVNLDLRRTNIGDATQRNKPQNTHTKQGILIPAATRHVAPPKIELKPDEYIATVKEPKNESGFKRLAFEPKSGISPVNVNDKTGTLAPYAVGTKLQVRAVLESGSNPSVRSYEIIKVL
jgi:CRISPR-associated protein Cmr6